MTPRLQDGVRNARDPKIEFMSAAIHQARLWEGRTHPNPAVGAVVATGEKMVGSGFHRGPGTPHAEVEALRAAGASARGADLFVTLEPCCTFGRTPPCTSAVIAAGIRRVFACCLDPNPAVAGKGFAALREAGVECNLGPCEAEGREVDLPYHVFHEKNRPFVHLKWAQTLDGRASKEGGGYLTGEAARARVHEERYMSDAILVAAATVTEDDPLLTVRRPGGEKRLLRVILDKYGRIGGGERVFETCPEGGPVMVIRPNGATGAKLSDLEGAGVKKLGVDGAARFRAGDILRLLRGEQVVALYVEGVGNLAWTFLSENLVDRLSVHIAPRLSGGDHRRLALKGDGFPPGEMLSLEGATWEQLGPDMIVTKDFPGAESLDS